MAKTYTALKLLFIMSMLGLHTKLLAQDMLRGQVLDAASQAPLEFVTVFFDGTTVGELTDGEGRFILPLSKIQLPALLSISHIGYKPVSMQIEEAQPLLISLEPAEYDISTIEVEDENRRAENLKEFREEFLGRDEWADNTELIGTESLYFERQYRRDTVPNAKRVFPDRNLPDRMRNSRWLSGGDEVSYDKRTHFFARTQNAITIDLPHLGYRIQGDIREFNLDYDKGLKNYFGTFFFQPYEQFGEEPKARHRRNREQAYLGSSQHFLHELYANTLDSAGFVVFRKSDTLNASAWIALDLEEYLERPVNQERLLTGLSGAELRVVYFGNRRRKPRPFRGSNPRNKYSMLYVHADAVTIRADGTIGEPTLFFSGNIASRGAAWLLPSDYRLSN